MEKRVLVFLEFLIGGVILGIIEDILIIKILTHEPITFHVFFTVFLVTLPFAFIGEYIVDNIDFIKIFKLNKKYKKLELFLEFLVFGIIVGVIEDLTAFYFAIGNPITLKVVLVATCVAVPFAFLGELIIDRINFSYEKKKFYLKEIK
jgi:hypothetical protein